MGVTYTDRLPETCDAASGSDRPTPGARLSGSVPALQALHDAGAALIPTDPKKAYDLCRLSYKNATRGSTRQQ